MALEFTLVDMTAEQYSIIRRFLENTSGIVLGDNKQYLVKNRLSTILLKYSLNSFAALVAVLQSESVAAKKIKISVIDAMTTNETFWFRDDQQFIELKEKILPELLRSKRTLRIWSAACSTGQEPYSISMCVENLAKTGNADAIQIVGTDISEAALMEAKSAEYSDMMLARGLDTTAKTAYFQAVTGGYRVKPEIMRRVKFQKFNLLDPFIGLGHFDIIFCRNVLIYFSQEVKRDILRRMSGVLASGGYLFLSSTESMPADLAYYEIVRGVRTRYFRKTTE